MKRSNPSSEQVDISSDEEDEGPVSKKSCSDATFDQPPNEVEDSLLRRAEIYQEYMKQIPIPCLRGSVVPFNTWIELGMSLKELYGQPLHYLTNIHLRQLDQSRAGTADEDVPLDIIISPPKAEASIWLIEEVHRLSSSPHHLAKLWRDDPLYHAFIDPIFPDLPKTFC
ncbi:hypothetical protein M9H77_18788 [Catharanthus roseus]|uniref:Uncharacterized protein n=1 Tax=Catharanthus roseus TaxID=4058 RepID=A0ACC0B8K5_CATRO|nr:hypothetical protein M9H77_18788 [Catharanthus roseus]